MCTSCYPVLVVSEDRCPNHQPSRPWKLLRLTRKNKFRLTSRYVFATVFSLVVVFSRLRCALLPAAASIADVSSSLFRFVDAIYGREQAQPGQGSGEGHARQFQRAGNQVPPPQAQPLLSTIDTTLLPGQFGTVDMWSWVPTLCARFLITWYKTVSRASPEICCIGSWQHLRNFLALGNLRDTWSRLTLFTDQI